MDIKVKVELDAANIAKLQEAAKKAMDQTMEAFGAEVMNAQVIPRDKGDLTESQVVSFAVVNKGLTAWLSYNEPYARRLYFHPEYDFRKDQHVNARGRWLDDWIYGSKKQWLPDTFLEFWKANAGGVIK